MAAYNESEKKDVDYQWLRGDTRLTIVGGSDTTAATLTFLFYHLAKDPSQVDKLRAELEPLLNGKTRLDAKDVAKAQHLNGVIQEALRLHPAIPSGFPRLTPPEGITVSGTYIPGDMIVVLPVYAMQHDENNYEDAEKFVPERWYSRPEMIKNREAFLTWNIGEPACLLFLRTRSNCRRHERLHWTGVGDHRDARPDHALDPELQDGQVRARRGRRAADDADQGPFYAGCDTVEAHFREEVVGVWIDCLRKSALDQNTTECGL